MRHGRIFKPEGFGTRLEDFNIMMLANYNLGTGYAMLTHYNNLRCLLNTHPRESVLKKQKKTQTRNNNDNNETKN